MPHPFSFSATMPEVRHFLETDLGMGMQIAPDGGEFFGIAVDAVDGGHVCYPVTEDVERDCRRLG